MLILYRIFTFMLYAFIHPIGKEKAALGRELWKGRMGLIPKVGPCHVWLHAASVGEVRVISYLVSFLKREKPNIKIHVTTVTPAGYRTALESIDSDITLSYFPLDVPSVVKKTLDKIEPDMIAFAETEIWPNLIVEAAARKIPMILVNGRMSARAFRRYRLVRSSLGRLLGCYDRFFFKTEEDAERYRYFLGRGGEAGAPVGEVGGDMKFDAPLNDKSAEQIKSIRDRLGVAPDQFLLVAGSTRPGEEAVLARLFKKLVSADDRFSLLLAPRHLERVEEIKALLRDMGLSFAVYPEASGSSRLIVVNKMGLLHDLFAAANLAFVGGTLADIGGHNVLEPVWAGTPVLFGPSLSNVKEAAEYIITNNFGAMVKSEDELTQVVEEVLKGRKAFRIKTEMNLKNSATARAGSYILSRLENV
jgi:3-deoxy-D-manno-octulosonic-acid transferase